MNILPKARTENLVEQNLKNETLLYDLLIDKAFNLNETSTIVYKACNGVTTFDELKRRHKFTDEFIFLALDELKRSDLLAKKDSYISPFAGVNRREVIKKVGLASMFVLPIISGLIAPKASQAASNAGDGNSGSGFAVFGACDQYGACYSDGQYNLNCVGGRCCRATPTGTGSALPGTRISVPENTCGFAPSATINCNEFIETENQCCSGEVQGTCVTEPEPWFENDYAVICANGYWGYKATCNCYCG